jgi:hypothetical protein
MAEERDIWESARNMIERYGPDALRQVRLRIQELGEYGQSDARRHWLRIENAVKVLLETKDSKRKH